MVLLRFGEMDFAMLLDHQMRIHKYNKINKRKANTTGKGNLATFDGWPV